MQQELGYPSASDRPRRRVQDFRIAALAVLLLLVTAGVSGCAMETPTRTTYTRTPVATNTPVATPTPVPVAQPSATLPVVRPTATPEPGGKILILTPGAADAGWWSSGDVTGIRLGDSFLHSGYFDDEVFVSAVRLDLRQVPRGATIRNAALELTGLRDDRLDLTSESAKWNVQLIDPKEITDFARSNFQELYNAPASVTLFPSLTAKDLGVRRVNTLTFDATARDWLSRQVLDGVTSVIVRLTGPDGAPTSLFAWDSGSGQMTGGAAPRLVLNMGAPPATPPPLPTRPTLVVTSTPTPANVLTVAANALTGTAIARGGTSAPSQFAVVTATPDQRVVITYTPVPQNGATATAQAAYATAVAVTTGTFTPMPKDAVTPIVVLPTPMPENVLTAAVQMVAAAAEIARRGLSTPLPYNAVIATVTPTPLVLVNTPRPLNVATARAQVAYATAAAMTTGTPTPLPPSVATPTSPPPTPLLVYLDDLLLASATPTATPGAAMPRELLGKVLFLSDRDGSARLYALDPANGRLAYLTEAWPYLLAKSRQMNSAHGKYNLSVQQRIDNARPDDPNPQVPGVFLRDNEFRTSRLLTPVKGWSYDPAFALQGNRVVFVSNEPGNDEIYTVDVNGTNMQRLTSNTWEWDKHPTWSPDGSQILFWSNRDSGHRQLWIMSADGKNQRPFLPSGFNDWDPVWVK